jgi:hypothetical protein
MCLFLSCLNPIPWFYILKIYTLTLELVVVIMLRQQFINECRMFEYYLLFFNLKMLIIFKFEPKIVIHVNFIFYNKYKL